MRRKTQATLLAIVVCIIAIILMIMGYLSGRVSKIPAGTVGNTAGNLNNSGYFCEYDGTVYFANSFDGGSLYAMDPLEGNIRKLNDMSVRNILAGGKYLFFFQTGSASQTSGVGGVVSTRSFIRSNLTGDAFTVLNRETIVNAQLVDNTLYLLRADTTPVEFYRMGIDKSDKQVLAEYPINPHCVYNGDIYFNGTQDDHSLHKLDVTSDRITEEWRSDIWNPIIEGGYVYYMDVPNNYRLCRYSFSQDVVEVLTNDRIDCFNVGNGYIYYQKSGDQPQLKCMLTDGTAEQVIADGVFNSISMTSRYVYFKEFGDDITLYHTPLGANYYDVFQSAHEAALAN